MIIDKIVEIAENRAASRKVKDVRIGLAFLCVVLDDDSMGCSFIFTGEFGTSFRFLKDAGNLIGRSALELSKWALDAQDLLKSSIGVAVLNALTRFDFPGINENREGLDEIDFRLSDTVGMIGYFKPLIPELEGKIKELRIFERKPSLHLPFVYPDWAEERLLKDCDVVIISGTTLINKTTDQITRYCKNARDIILMGPSTLIYPEAYANTAITVLASSKVKPSAQEDMIKLISQGGGGEQLHKIFTKYSTRIADCNLL